MYNASMKKVDTEFKTLQNFIVDYKLTGAEKTTLAADRDWETSALCSFSLL